MQQTRYSTRFLPQRRVAQRVALAFFAMTAIASAVLPAPTFAAPKSAASAGSAGPASRATPQQGDAAFLAARDAYRAGEPVRLARHLESLHGHPLQPWAYYWQLRLALDNDPLDGGQRVRGYLERHAGTYIADKLRGDWMRALGKRGDWESFNREYPLLVQADDEVRCYAGVAAGDTSPALSLFLAGKDLPAACETLVTRLIANEALSVEDVWQRIRRQFEAKRVGAAARSAAYLPAGEGWAQARGLEAAAQSPAAYLVRLPADFAGQRGGREAALFAIQRLARTDAADAAQHLSRIEARLAPEERAYGWSQVAQWGAMTHRPEALAWYEKATGTLMSEETLAWQVRAALRAGNWNAVRHAVAAMPPTLAALPDWTYWRARALMQAGQTEEARRLLQQISGQPNFYSNLADEELGRALDVPPRAAVPTREELASAAANPAFQRALALMRVDMRIEGVREWVFALRGLDDRQLLAAASFAHSREVWDRAINTADRTQSQHDYSLRFVAPFHEQVRPKATELGLDDAWVYGLMRQESRFVTNATSSAGAKGLMQLMPTTARWVAKKINMGNFSQDRVTDMDTNVTLGTNYMKMVLESLDNHPVLASAAYNAGPGRARRWRAERPLEGAIYAETIPFNETRDYVKKVMSNAVYYGALFEQRPQSLKARLGTIRARGDGERSVEQLP